MKSSIKKQLVAAVMLIALASYSQIADTTKKVAPEKNALKFNLNEIGSHYFQVTFLNQTWARWNESNDGTTQFGKDKPSTIDIGLRRTRIQMFGQITERTFIYFQYGQNNYNNTFAWSAGATGIAQRKFSAFFHDALCEYKVIKGKSGNTLKIGGGLTVMNGLSRFSQPSIGSIMTLDVPVFLQYTVDATDQFDRRLALYARGQVGKLDYRVYISNPFPVNSNGAALAALDSGATFVDFSKVNTRLNPGVNNQYGGYFAWNFFDNEGHNTPYMQGTYLGAKKVFNIAIGGVYQKAATWYLKRDSYTGPLNDTAFADMMHFSVESFLDMPLNKDKGTAVSAFLGYYNINYGANYLRYNGLMNPATGFNSMTTNYVQKNAYGNAIPMFGTGQCMYAQVGYLLPKKLLGEGKGQLMPYVSAQYANYAALQHKTMLMVDIGCNWLIKGHNSKISIDYQSRPTFYKDSSSKTIEKGKRMSCIIIQYQVFI